MPRISVRLAVLALVALASAQAQAQSKESLDPLSIFGQEVSIAVDRAADLSVYATLCGVVSEAAAVNLRDAVSRKLAACFKADSKAATWAADVLTHYDGKRTLLLDLTRMRGKDTVCSRLYESDGKTLSAFGKEVVADGQRYAASADSAPIASRPCP
jgi:hypothetical protein